MKYLLRFTDNQNKLNLSLVINKSIPVTILNGLKLKLLTKQIRTCYLQ